MMSDIRGLIQPLEACSVALTGTTTGDTMQPLAVISEAARITGATEAMIRDLCKREIISPQRDSSGRRLFGPGDLKRISDYLARAARGRNAA